MFWYVVILIMDVRPSQQFLIHLETNFCIPGLKQDLTENMMSYSRTQRIASQRPFCMIIILVLIPQATNEGSDEPRHQRILARHFDVFSPEPS